MEFGVQVTARTTCQGDKEVVPVRDGRASSSAGSGAGPPSGRSMGMKEAKEWKLPRPWPSASMGSARVP